MPWCGTLSDGRDTFCQSGLDHTHIEKWIPVYCPTKQNMVLFETCLLSREQPETQIFNWSDHDCVRNYFLVLEQNGILAVKKNANILLWISTVQQSFATHVPPWPRQQPTNERRPRLQILVYFRIERNMMILIIIFLLRAIIKIKLSVRSYPFQYEEIW